MNAPPNIDPVATHSDNDVVYWLTIGTRDERFIDNIFAELCWCAAGIGVSEGNVDA